MENTSIFLNLSESEMLALCKRLLNLEPARRDCTVERDDGIDIDEWLTVRARAWYAALLSSGPVAWLPVEDLKNDVTATNTDGVVTAVYPTRCARPIEWKLGGWQCSVTRFVHPDDDIARLQHNPWTRGRCCHPVAVDHGNRLLLYSIDPDATPVVDMARCVATPVNGHFVFGHAAIPDLQKFLADQQP
ncbi:MAG: hypothetical protein KBT10_01705 [Bacteroidales bacterium]|nr:hypothetical protein [Candidatus Sodaliphilus aphodohippi]